jgi:hypothetical protein
MRNLRTYFKVIFKIFLTLNLIEIFN